MGETPEQIKNNFRNSVMKIVRESTLELIREETFTLDTKKFTAIKSELSNIENYKTAARNTDFTSTNENTVAQYILKKRAALVYMCMLYIKKLQESRTQESGKLKAIIAQLEQLQQIVGQNPVNTANTTDESKASALITAITTDVTKLISEKNKKDALFDDIIPFVATQAEVSNDSGLLND